MKKRIISLVLSLFLVISFAFIGCNKEINSSGNEPNSSSSYSSSSFENSSSSNKNSSSSSSGNSSVNEEPPVVDPPIIDPPVNENSQIKNVIYLIADGLSSSTIDLARDLKGSPLYMDEIMIGQAMVSTTNLSTLMNPNQSESWKISYTDSSSCGNALATGRKTYKNGQGEVIHNNDNGLVYANDGVKTDWKNGEIERLQSILTLAQQQGKKTAVITTADVLDSTPSVFYSHSERGYWDTIYSDLKKSQIDVIVGTNSYAGNTLASWRNEFSAMGYECVEYNDKSDLNAIEKGDKYISIGQSGNGNHDPFWDYNNYQAGNIRIFEYFEKTLDIFDGEENGFFIMLEGGEVDIGGHNDESQHALSELYAFDQTVGMAVDYAASRDDTIVVVSVDHGNSQFHYANGASASSFNLTFNEENYFYSNFSAFTSWMKSNVTKNYEGHTLENVMLAMYVPENVTNIFEGKTLIENTEIPRFIASLLNIDIDKENRLYNGIEVEDAFGYVTVDFNSSLTVGTDDNVSVVNYWGPNTSGCGFATASSVGFHDSENIKGDTCYKLRCLSSTSANTGITIVLPEPIDTKSLNLTSLTLRCQVSVDAVDAYPMCRLYKGSNDILNSTSTNGVSLAQYANSKVIDVNLGAIDFSKLADADGVIRSFTLSVRSKSSGYVYLDELRFAYEI